MLLHTTGTSQMLIIQSGSGDECFLLHNPCKQIELISSQLSSTSLFWRVELQSIATSLTASAGFNPKSHSQGSCHSCEFDPESLPDEIPSQLSSLSPLGKTGSVSIVLDSTTLLTTRVSPQPRCKLALCHHQFCLTRKLCF